jgi:dTDP-4-amino-4,6-dideoxygalactose transaminase
VREESEVSLLEKEFAELVGQKYAIAMNSCSSALFVSLISAGVKPGDKVLMPAFTFIAVPGSIVHAGAQPVLVEMTKDYVMDLDDLEKKITSDTKFLLLSHMRGRITDMDRVVEICDRRGVTLIEDCAHSLGVQWNGVQTGKFGVASAFSMQSAKMIDSGEGGILVTDNKEIAVKAMMYAGCFEHNWTKHFGIDDDDEYVRSMVNTLPAYNFRMSNLSAAALRPQIGEIEERVELYNTNYDRFIEIISESSFVSVPEQHEKVRIAANSAQFYIKDLDEDQIADFVSFVKDRGVDIQVFGLSDANSRCFWHWSFFERNESADFTKELLMRTADLKLPLNYSIEDIERIAGIIMEGFKSVAGKELAYR